MTEVLITLRTPLVFSFSDNSGKDWYDRGPMPPGVLLPVVEDSMRKNPVRGWRILYQGRPIAVDLADLRALCRGYEDEVTASFYEVSQSG